MKNICNSSGTPEFWKDILSFYEELNLNKNLDLALKYLDQIELKEPGFISRKFFDTTISEYSSFIALQKKHPLRLFMALVAIRRQQESQKNQHGAAYAKMLGEDFVSLEVAMHLILRNRDNFMSSPDFPQFDELVVALEKFPSLLKFV